MSKKLNIAERFELAVPVGVLIDMAISVHDEQDGFPTPVGRVAKSAQHRDVTREHGILNYPTHHAANLSAMRALYNLSPTVGA